MKGFRAVLAFLLIAVLALGVKWYVSRPNDAELIRSAISEATTAAKEGRSGPVVDFLSRSLQLNGVQVGVGGEVADFVRKNKPDVSVLTPEASIHGDKASIVSDVRIGIRLGPLPIEQTIKKVTIVLEKEPATIWGILPTHRWRIASIDADADSLSGLGG